MLSNRCDESQLDLQNGFMDVTKAKRQSKKPFIPDRIVSGGQTGVDRAGLEVAIALGIEHGGWCPLGRRSEDGTIPSRYLLQETDSIEYPFRTEKNVVDSDATLILYASRLKGGTLLTRRICERNAKEHLVVRFDKHEPDLVRDWLRDVRPSALNIAGPRESTSQGIFELATQYLHAVFASYDVPQ